MSLKHCIKRWNSRYYKKEVTYLRDRIKQLEKEKAKLYDRCLKNEDNYLQFIRKLTSYYKKALDEIAERHSKKEVEVDGTTYFSVACGCEFCEQWRMLNKQQQISDRSL